MVDCERMPELSSPTATKFEDKLPAGWVREDISDMECLRDA